jgi:hypothetical protein
MDVKIAYTLEREVLKAVSKESAVFWVATPRNSDRQKHRIEARNLADEILLECSDSEVMMAEANRWTLAELD